LFVFDERISQAQQDKIFALDAKLVQADANLLNEQRLTARE
jgi:hypothetical protein